MPGTAQEKIKTEGGVVYGEIKAKDLEKVKKVLSSVLAATLVLGSVPASTFWVMPYRCVRRRLTVRRSMVWAYCAGI